MSYVPPNQNGSATSANSAPVVIASDQATVPVSNATGATSAKQDTGNTSIASIDTKTPALGQALAAASVPVVLPAATVTTLTPPAALTNFANETGGNLAAAKTDLDTLVTRIPVQGQALAAASVPVVLTAAQVTTLTPPAAITGFATAAKQPALGTAGSASTDVITVQGIASGTAQPVSAASLPLPALAATSTKQSDGTQKTQLVDGSGNVVGSTTNALDVNIKSGASSGAVAQGSTTSGQTGGLTQAAVTTSAPTYTTAQTSPLSLTTAGALRTDASATTQPVSIATAPALVASTAIIGKVTTDQTTHGTTDLVAADITKLAGTTVDTNSGNKSAGTQRVVIATDQPNLTTALNVSLASVPSHAVTNAGTFAVQAAAAGDVASGSTDSGNPQKIGGVGKTANPTAVTDGQRVNATFDKLGKQVVAGSIRDLKANQQTTITASTSETTIVTAIASTFCDLYGLILTNSSATATVVTIKDSTAGTTQAVIAVPAGDTRGFMLPESAALKQTTVNTAWTATSSASITSLLVSALYVKNI